MDDEGNERVYKEIAERHQRMADLPYEEKLEIFLKLCEQTKYLKGEFEKSRSAAT
jgi:hypothetical protein